VEDSFDAFNGQPDRVSQIECRDTGLRDVDAQRARQSVLPAERVEERNRPNSDTRRSRHLNHSSSLKGIALFGRRDQGRYILKQDGSLTGIK
jgi:hypothetical protein